MLARTLSPSPYAARGGRPATDRRLPCRAPPAPRGDRAGTGLPVVDLAGEPDQPSVPGRLRRRPRQGRRTPHGGRVGLAVALSALELDVGRPRRSPTTGHKVAADDRAGERETAYGQHGCRPRPKRVDETMRRPSPRSVRPAVGRPKMTRVASQYQERTARDPPPRAVLRGRGRPLLAVLATRAGPPPAADVRRLGCGRHAARSRHRRRWRPARHRRSHGACQPSWYFDTRYLPSARVHWRFTRQSKTWSAPSASGRVFRVDVVATCSLTALLAIVLNAVLCPGPAGVHRGVTPPRVGRGDRGCGRCDAYPAPGRHPPPAEPSARSAPPHWRVPCTCRPSDAPPCSGPTPPPRRSRISATCTSPASPKR